MASGYSRGGDPDHRKTAVESGIQRSLIPEESDYYGREPKENLSSLHENSSSGRQSHHVGDGFHKHAADADYQERDYRSRHGPYDEEEGAPLDTRRDGPDWPRRSPPGSHWEGASPDTKRDGPDEPRRPPPGPHWEGADRPVLLSDLMDMMMLQNVGNRDLEERWLRLKEEKLRMEKESYIARSRDRELDRQLKEAPKFPTMTQDTEVIGEAADIQAVQTRAQRKRDEQLCLEDDEASAQSGAIPRELCSLDDTLFATSKTKPKLTRSLKRVKAKEWLAQEDKAVQDTEPQLVDLSPEELEKAQHDDTTLAELWNDATADIGGFFVSEGVLRRHHHDEWGDDMAQVVAPTAHRQEILALAHDGPLTAHLGYKKTLEKLLRNFWWPGVQQDVKCHCQTCGDCQRGARGSKGKAPLMPLPAVDEPFRRIAMDIVGPLKRSKRGNKYILTLMDFSTRFPEAIPLRRVDAQTVADAMMGVFCRLGFPEEILTDQGSNFMSEIMRRVTDLLGVKQLKTSPYHPECDGMLERFHATLKLMMRKTCKDRDRWDDYLPYACFAFRDAVHSATQFSPFQLLLGRNVRGPLSLIKSQLTGETKGTTKVVEFVDKLKEKLTLAWDMAAGHDEEAKAKSKSYFDRRATTRTFEVGDTVMTLEPSPTDKFQPQWNGPYKIVEKVTEVTYRVFMPDRRKKEKLFHVNGLKAWQSLPETVAVVFCEEDSSVDANEGPEIFPFEQDGEMKPQINTQLTSEQRGQIERLCTEFADVFDPAPGCTNCVEHSIPTGNAKPIYHQPRRVPLAWAEKVREEISGMLKAGVIEPSTSPWTSPIVPVRKKDGGTRVCIDYRKLNTVTEEDRYPMPRIEEMLEKLGKAEFISTLDLSKGYYQVAVKKEDQPKTAFITPSGKFQFKRMPFGLKGAPSSFQRLMDQVLAPCSKYADAYIDDIAIFSSTWEEHLSQLKEVLLQLRQAGLTAKPVKCKLAQKECGYLGHRVGGGHIMMEEAKVTAVKEFKRPRVKRDIRAFLGLTGYYRRFIEGYAQMTAHLSDRTKKEYPNTVQWTPELEKDFQELKDKLATRPVLQCPDISRPYILQTDASERGIGAVLSQEDEKGEEKPIAFFSRKLKPRESRYASVEKECLAIVMAVQHFAVYLVGQRFTIVTDHRALQYLHTMHNSNARLTRWTLAMQPFEYDVKYRPGAQNGNADGLSRQAWPEQEDSVDTTNSTRCFAAEEGGEK